MDTITINGITYIAETADAPAAPAAPAASRPTFGRVASPFASAKSAKPETIADTALRLYPGDRPSAKRHVALSMAPGWSCTVDATVEVDGVETPTALHGFLTERKSGDPCPGVYGIARGESCPGTIR